MKKSFYDVYSTDFVTFLQHSDEKEILLHEITKIIKKYKINRDDPDNLLERLLPMNLSIGSKKVDKLAINYLIAYNLRNYGGHNIKMQNCLVNNFDKIFQILMNCIIHSVSLL